MKWIFPSTEPKLISQIQDEFRVSKIIAKVMATRGLASSEQTTPFFNPDISLLHDPFLMKNMEKAVERIINAIKSHQPIMIFGDYDVDGTTAASLLFIGLKNLGAEVSTYIPNRETEGYGLSELGIDTAKKTWRKIDDYLRLRYE